MRLVVLFLFIFGSWCSTAVPLSQALSKMDFESEVSLRTKLFAGAYKDSPTNAVQFSYRNQFTYPFMRGGKFVFGVSTGEQDQTRSRYIDLGSFSARSFSLDKLSVSVRNRFFTLSAGKMENPYHRGISNDFLFDKDLRVEGFHGFARPLPCVRVDASHFFIESTQVDVFGSKRSFIGSVLDPESAGYLMSFQARCNRRILRQKATVGLGFHRVLDRDFAIASPPRDLSSSMVEVYGHLSARGKPLAVYGSWIMGGVTESDLGEEITKKGNSIIGSFANIDKPSKDRDRDNLKSFTVGFNYRFLKKKAFFNYAYVNLSETPFQGLMNSDMVPSSFEDLSVHYFYGSYNLSKSQQLSAKYAVRNLNEDDFSYTFILALKGSW